MLMLVSSIERIPQINALPMIAREEVEAERDHLVAGVTAVSRAAHVRHSPTKEFFHFALTRTVTVVASRPYPTSVIG